MKAIYVYCVDVVAVDPFQCSGELEPSLASASLMLGCGRDRAGKSG